MERENEKNDQKENDMKDMGIAVNIISNSCYAIEKVPDSEKLLHFATDELPQNDSSSVHDKLWDIFSKTQSFWIPSEDVKNYIKNMRQSYVDLYIFGYSLLFVLAISHKKKEIKH